MEKQELKSLISDMKKSLPAALVLVAILLMAVLMAYILGPQ